MMSEGLTWKNTLPGGVVGAIISGVVLYMGYQNQVSAMTATALTGGAQSETLLVELLVLGGLILGGFVAAFMSKGGKEGLSKCIVAPFFSGLVTGLLLTILIIALEPLEKYAEAGLDPDMGMLTLVVSMIPVTAFLISLSVIGGLICAHLTKSKDSILKDVFKEAKNKFSWKLVVPALVLLFAPLVAQTLLAEWTETTILSIAETVTETNALLSILGIMLFFFVVNILFLSFSITGVVGGMSKKKDLTQAFKDSITQSKHVFVAVLFLLFIVPLILLAVLPIIQLPILWVIAILLAYYLFASFVAPIAYIRKEYLKCIKESFRFVKDKFLLVIAFYSLFLLVLMVVAVAVFFLPVDELVIGLAATVFMGVFFLFVTASQTVLYSKVVGVEK